MITARNLTGALVFAIGFCLIGTALDGPTDIEAAQDVADDATETTQLAQDTAACRQHYGPNAQILMLDRVHLVCRPAAHNPAPATTTAQVQP